MNTLVLTVTDLNTITNALSSLADACRRDADEAPNSPVGRSLATAARQSADQYESLASRIATADEIRVEL
jgi:hypothetical protein